ncbi:MAG: type III-B CRISPR-associated protein Cas10/Cmr2 [Desulfurococcales archaeon]|nr:type III-B CRISPR-associated protein Cas10/Cmr2 [Desulfurococcales archaeon]
MEREPRGLPFYAIKIAALFHDPAWKPWVVAGPGRILAWRETSRPRGKGVEACEGLIMDPRLNLDAHELDAVVAVRKIFPDDIADHAIYEISHKDSVMKRADRLAASLDRWMLTYLGKGEKVRVEADSVSYANPLEPKFKAPLQADVEPERVCKYVKSLQEIVRLMSSAKLPTPLQYNIIYLLLEPLWYDNCPKCVPLADTRTPTHTVFDHVYATASMTNWVLEGESGPSGFLVEIDIAGIQKFISAARKVRDLWAGSWLVSALAWYTVADAVKVLGADIVLSPFTSGNHFFIATLLAELGEHARRDKLAQRLLEKVEDVAERAFLWRGAASQPIAPGTYFLALPCLPDKVAEGILSELEDLRTVDVELARELVEALRRCDAEAVERYFRLRFRRAWQAVVEAILSEEALGVKGPEGLAEKLGNAGVLAESLDAAMAARYLKAAAEEPPMQLRVVVVDVRKAYEALIKKLGGKLKGEVEEIARSLGEGFDKTLREVAGKLLFTYLFSVARVEKEYEERVKDVSVEPGYSIAAVLEELTKSGFRDCTMCSRLPAVLHVRDQDSLERLSQTLGGLPRSLFTRGELLCPYCLYKRLLSIRSALASVSGVLKLYVNPKTLARVYSRPPSTCELAALNAVLGVVDRLVAGRRGEGRDWLSDLKTKLHPMAGSASGYGLHDALVAYVKERCSGDDRCVDDIVEVLQELEVSYDFSCLMISTRGLKSERLRGRCIEFYCGPRGEHCGKAELRRYTEFCDYIKPLLEDASREAGAYYMIVRGDGDNFGKKIVRGLLDYENSSEYVKEVANSIRDPRAAHELAGEYRELAERLAALARKLGLKEAPVTLVTPAYYTALSRGQMITAITDALLATSLAGFPVYAGGDDVAVLAPGYLEAERLRVIFEHYRKVVEPHRSMLASLSIPEPRGFSGAEIVYVTRLNYWGLLQSESPQGFHRTPVGAVYPAPAAYGRSYGVLVAHYRDPFQALWGSAGRLEEMKDIIIFKEVDSGYELSKDAIFIAYGRVSGLGGTPFHVVPLPNRYPDRLKWDPSGVADALQRAVELAAAVAGGSRAPVSKSIYSDFQAQCDTAERIAAYASKSHNASTYDLAVKLAAMLARRNAEDRQSQDWVAGILTNMVPRLLPSITNDGDNASLLACRAPMPWLLVLASRYIISGAR